MIHPLDDAHHRIEVLTPTRVHSRSGSNPSHRRYWQSGYQEGIDAALRHITHIRHASHIEAHSIAMSWSSASYTITVLWSPRYLRKLRHQLSNPLASHIRAGMPWPPRSSELSIGPLPIRIPHRLIEDALDATTDSQRTRAVKAIVTAYASIINRLTEPLTLPCDFPNADRVNPSTTI